MKPLNCVPMLTDCREILVHTFSEQCQKKNSHRKKADKRRNELAKSRTTQGRSNPNRRIGPKGQVCDSIFRVLAVRHRAGTLAEMIDQTNDESHPEPSGKVLHRDAEIAATLQPDPVAVRNHQWIEHKIPS